MRHKMNYLKKNIGTPQNELFKKNINAPQNELLKKNIR